MSSYSIASADPTPALCREWHDRHDIAAADALARLHRQLVVVIAAGYAPGGRPSSDLIAEGHVGLMRAICRFDPDGNLHFGACVALHVHAAIFDHVRRKHIERGSPQGVPMQPARARQLSNPSQLRVFGS
jgi:DNA-directed RNA polymerase sigma subunit (sigma70/sigma32)